MPIFKSAYICLESAETMSHPNDSAMLRLNSVFPTPVGPISTKRVFNVLMCQCTICQYANVLGHPVFKKNDTLAYWDRLDELFVGDVFVK